MGTIIAVEALHAFLCVRDRSRAKQFWRMRRANLKAKKHKGRLRRNIDGQ